MRKLKARTILACLPHFAVGSSHNQICGRQATRKLLNWSPEQVATYGARLFAETVWPLYRKAKNDARANGIARLGRKVHNIKWNIDKISSFACF